MTSMDSLQQRRTKHMSSLDFTAALNKRISEEYVRCRYGLGWRLLYSPVGVLGGARVAFIGLNPGGRAKSVGQAEFSMESGSAYTDEVWGNFVAGEHRLQKEVKELFHLLGEHPKNVLAGNLVPFRSPSWGALASKDDAVAFGCELWCDIIERAKPDIVITMGGVVNEAIWNLFNVTLVEKVPLNWGRVTARLGVSARRSFIALPHLSRFPVITRIQSRATIMRLLNDA